jgi:hypothetical protein
MLNSALGSVGSVGSELGSLETFTIDSALGLLEKDDGCVLLLGLPEGVTVGKNEGGLVWKSSTWREITVPHMST